MNTEDGLPNWASVALTQACRDENWIPLCDILHGEIKQQLEGNLVSKRFSELTETEQASLVEHHYRELCSRGNKDHLDPFIGVMNRAVDEQLLHIILKKSLNKEAVQKSGYGSNSMTGDSKKDKEENQAMIESKREEVANETTLEFLMGEISDAVIELLEKSAPALRNTLTMFLNRPLPNQIRVYIWSKSLRLDQQRLEDGSALFAGRLAPSVDLILSRRCHALLDTSFSVVSSRANASFVKTIVTNFMRLTGMKVPDTASDNFEDMEHIVYLLIPLLVILRSNMYELLTTKVKGNTVTEAAATTNADNEDVPTGHPLLGHDPRVAPGTIEFFEDNYTTNLDAKISTTKRINIMENALYSLLEPRFLGLVELAEIGKKTKRRKGEEADAEAKADIVASTLYSSNSKDKKKNEESITGTFKFVQRAPGMDQAVTLLSAKSPKLAKMLLSLERYGGQDGTEADLGYGATAPPGKIREHEITYFVLSQSTTWREFMNEMLLRGLSGLLNLEVTLFIWDQGFVTDFGAMLPCALIALIVGAGPEIGSLVSYRNVVETFISFCRTVDVEQMQRLLVEHCENEMKEFGQMEGASSSRDDGVMTENFRKISMNM